VSIEEQFSSKETSTEKFPAAIPAGATEISEAASAATQPKRRRFRGQLGGIGGFGFCTNGTAEVTEREGRRTPNFLSSAASFLEVKLPKPPRAEAPQA
jgi:hypothetical protein